MVGFGIKPLINKNVRFIWITENTENTETLLYCTGLFSFSMERIWGDRKSITSFHLDVLPILE